jgi:hypothetical protein
MSTSGLKGTAKRRHTRSRGLRHPDQKQGSPGRAFVTETVDRKQLRPVIQSGATVMDRLFTNDTNGIGGQFGGHGSRNAKKPGSSVEEPGCDQRV